jgi:hypothetical protein
LDVSTSAMFRATPSAVAEYDELLRREGSFGYSVQAHC